MIGWRGPDGGVEVWAQGSGGGRMTKTSLVSGRMEIGRGWDGDTRSCLARIIGRQLRRELGKECVDEDANPPVCRDIKGRATPPGTTAATQDALSFPSPRISRTFSLLPASPDSSPRRVRSCSGSEPQSRPRRRGETGSFEVQFHKAGETALIYPTDPTNANALDRACRQSLGCSLQNASESSSGPTGTAFA